MRRLLPILVAGVALLSSPPSPLDVSGRLHAHALDIDAPEIDRVSPDVIAISGSAHSNDRRLEGPGSRAKTYRTGYISLEPTLGVPEPGTVVLYPAFIPGNQVKPFSLARSRDGGRSWELVEPIVDHRTSWDPFVHVDPTTGRVFILDLVPQFACNQMSYSDDAGDLWFRSLIACGRPAFNDHPSIAAGAPRTSAPVGYQNVVYICVNELGAAVGCAKSTDGGISFVATAPAFQSEKSVGTSRYCAGPSGHLTVGDDGILYMPKVCFRWYPSLAISKDEGTTWERFQVSRHGSAVDAEGFNDHEAAVGIDASGNIFYVWIREDRLPYLTTSTDGGRTWSEPVNVAPPGVNEATLPNIAVSPKGGVAVVYYGTENSPGPPFPDYAACYLGTERPCGEVPEEYKHTTWNGYITVTTTPRAGQPVFVTTSINPKDDPLMRGACGPSRCPAVLDFIDVVIDSKGRPWASFVDGCYDSCLTSSERYGQEALVATLVKGPRLR